MNTETHQFVSRWSFSQKKTSNYQEIRNAITEALDEYDAIKPASVIEENTLKRNLKIIDLKIEAKNYRIEKMKRFKFPIFGGLIRMLFSNKQLFQRLDIPEELRLDEIVPTGRKVKIPRAVRKENKRLREMFKDNPYVTIVNESDSQSYHRVALLNLGAAKKRGQGRIYLILTARPEFSNDFYGPEIPSRLYVVANSPETDWKPTGVSFRINGNRFQNGDNLQYYETFEDVRNSFTQIEFFKREDVAVEEGVEI